jgi:hypothetical protein
VRALAQVGRATDPELRSYALPSPPGARYDGTGEAAFVLEAVREGYLMHYGEPRAFDSAMDADTRLLAGDALYALGLARLAEGGQLEAIAELADLISGCARAHAEAAPERAEELWEASAGRLSALGGAPQRGVS